MDFRFTDAELAFQKEVEEFLASELSPEAIVESDSYFGYGPASRAFLRKLGQRGWLCASWPRELGGIGASHMQSFILQEALCYWRAPNTRTGGLVGSTMAGPTIMRIGSEQQKKEWLPRIASGEVEFALGYTEPQAGSDLAALEIRAVEDGDDYVINGQKMFNTSAHYADYHWLGARTDTTGPKHRGISLFIVDLKSPGITIRPLWTMGGMRTNEVFYDNVRVPKKNMVGEKNRGFYYVMMALDFERTWEVDDVRHTFEDIVDYAKATVVNGRPLSDDPVVRHKLAQTAIEMEIARLYAYKVAWMIDKGTVPSYEAAVLKTCATEMNQKVANLGMQVLNLYSQLAEGSKHAVWDGRLQRWYRHAVVNTIVAGTSEIMRNVIAIRGLDMPR